MGIDVHALNFLRYVKKYGEFDETITIGRQGFHIIESYVREPYIRNIINALAKSKNDKYSEGLLLNYFGASTVDSIDNSDYEGASIVHDMNLPIPSSMHKKYNTVIDAGTLEHIFNIPVALKNCSLLCKPGGQILHILPANNFCGHGFWQFSPELFFSLYSPENGYSNTEVFLADLSDISKWYKVKEPQGGKRVDVYTSNGLHVLVRTVLNRKDFSHENVQQSDYTHKWLNSQNEVTRENNLPIPTKAVAAIKRSKLFYSMLTPLYNSYYRLRPRPTRKLSSLNPGLIKYKVSSIIK